MVTNARIAELIRDNEPESITDAIEEGAFFDMQSFNTALIEHVLSGNVDQEVAANAATNRHDFLVSLDRALKQQSADLKAEEANEQQERPAPQQPREPEDEMPALRLAQAGD
jgi:Tfp pilus assembly ATPase PilU